LCQGWGGKWLAHGLPGLPLKAAKAARLAALPSGTAINELQHCRQCMLPAWALASTTVGYPLGRQLLSCLYSPAQLTTTAQCTPPQSFPASAYATGNDRPCRPRPCGPCTHAHARTSCSRVGGVGGLVVGRRGAGDSRCERAGQGRCCHGSARVAFTSAGAASVLSPHWLCIAHD